MQRKRMEGSGGDIPGMQARLNTLVHLLSRLAAKRQEQNLIGYGFSGRQQPACTRHQHRRFTASGARKHQQRLLTVHHRTRLRRIEGEDSTVLKKSAYWVSMASVQAWLWASRLLSTSFSQA